MGILTSLFHRALSLETPGVGVTDENLDTWGTNRQASSGVRVNRETALTLGAVWRGISLISRDVAKLPISVYKRLPTGGQEKDAGHSAYDLLRRRPNGEMTSFVFRQTLQAHALMLGNGYAWIDRDPNTQQPLQLIPLPPDPQRTYPVRYGGQLWYVTTTLTGELRRFPPQDVIHVKGFSFDGLVGYAWIDKAREALGQAMAIQKYGSVFFKNNAHHSVLLTHPGKLTPEARKNLRESWRDLHSGLDNAHKTALLEEGMSAIPFTINAKDALLVEQAEFTREDIANFLNLPPHKLGGKVATSYSSLEQENQAYLDSAIDPWLVSWEEECEEKLLTERQKARDSHFIRFDRRALIRANLSERAAYYTAALTNGWLSRDEVREEEGYNPIDDGTGSVYFVPGNLIPATEFINNPSPPSPSPDPAPPSGTDSASDSARAKLLAAHRQLLLDASSRIATRLAGHAKAAARDHREFWAWLDEFKGQHFRSTSEMLVPTAEALEAMGVSCNAPDLATRGLCRLGGELVELTGRCAVAELPAAVEDLMATYQSGELSLLELPEGVQDAR